MVRLLVLALTLLLVSSCASLNPLDVLNPNKPSLEVSAQVGKTNEQEKNNIKLETKGNELRQDADTISNDHNYNADSIQNIVQGMSTIELILLVLMAGVAIPPMRDIYKGVKVVISDTWYACVVVPFTLIASIFKRK